VPTISTGRFEWDQNKSAANEAKHGVSFEAAVGVWDSRWRSLPLSHPEEIRFLAIGVIKDQHWSVVYTMRGDRYRLISARRSRYHEKELYENHP
jgi:hypothetical protein